MIADYKMSVIYIWILIILFPILINDIRKQRIEEKQILVIRIVTFMYIIFYVIGYEQKLLGGGLQLMLFCIVQLMWKLTYRYFESAIGRYDMEVLFFVGICIPVREFLLVVVLSLVVLSLFGVIGILVFRWSRRKRICYMPFIYLSLGISAGVMSFG